MSYQATFVRWDQPLAPPWAFTDPIVKRQRRSVLVVEDDRDLWEVFRRTALRVDPHVFVEFVESAEEGLECLLGDTAYDLVLVDFLLAGQKNGDWLWRRCDTVQPWAIFAMTSSTPLSAIGDRDFPFLRKPFTVTNCRRFLTDLLV